MSKVRPRPKINPIIAKLSESGLREAVVPLRGFIGPSPSEDVVRLYSDLSMASYVEVASDKILHYEEQSESHHTPTTLWVTANAALTHVFRSTADAPVSPQASPPARRAGGSYTCNTIAYHATQLGLMAQQARERGDHATADAICRAREEVIDAWLSYGCLSAGGLRPEYGEACGSSLITVPEGVRRGRQ